MKKGKKILLGILAALLLVVIIVWIVGWTAPINENIPLLITLSRPTLNRYRENLTKNNEWLYACTPTTVHFGMPVEPCDMVKGLQTLSDHGSLRMASVFGVPKRVSSESKPMPIDW